MFATVRRYTIRDPPTAKDELTSLTQRIEAVGAH